MKLSLLLYTSALIFPAALSKRAKSSTVSAKERLQTYDSLYSSDDFDLQSLLSVSDSEDSDNYADELQNILDSASDSARQSGKRKDKKALYDAYNQLHTLAQAYDKPFDAPAIVVVGHQSSGKSALIEALMGFQFNEVGGGTKTRRPVALRMQYNPQCHEPRCFLVGDDGIERPMSLVAIQSYIEQENNRLTLDPSRNFSSKEINIRVEFKHCPNLILIDTPGLISAPRVSKKKGQDSLSDAATERRALQDAAKEAERLVVEKMGCEDYLILCVEDTNDWKHGVTREVVQKADPELSRTIIVNTKFDTKVPQFGSPADVEEFVRAPDLDKLCPHKLGGPFFTSVPSGRVGRDQSVGSASDYLYDNDGDFVSACTSAEANDYNLVRQRLKKVASASGKSKSKSSKVLSRIGIQKLRNFLEERVDDCYRRNVRKIIPMLQAEYASTERQLRSCDEELESISKERLKAGADAFCDDFCACLRKAIQGTIAAPVTLFGETLQHEINNAGSFYDTSKSPMSVNDKTWDELVKTEVGNCQHRLYGGSQYHRTLREFHLATRCLKTPVISEDEIANAAGVGDTHDGVNFLHTSCVIALEKARISFEPVLYLLQRRMTHVMDRLYPVTEYMVKANSDRAKVQSVRYVKDSSAEKDRKLALEGTMDISHNPHFQQLIREIFEDFVRRCSDETMIRCRDDLTSLTRFVTWNLGEGGSSALMRSLPEQTNVDEMYNVALASASGREAKADKNDLSVAAATAHVAVQNSDKSMRSLVQIVDEALLTRDSGRTNQIVSTLVQHIVSSWQIQFCKSVTTKFNCYFMVPFVDDFHRFLRDKLQSMYDGRDHGMSDVFDITTARLALEKRKKELQSECEANKRLQEKFRLCAELIE